MTNTFSKYLDEVLEELTLQVLEDNAQTVNGLTTIKSNAKKDLLSQHEKELEKARLEAAINAQDSHIGRLKVLRAWAVNHRPIFDKGGERASVFILHEIDNEVKIVKLWQADLRYKLKPNATKEKQ